MVFVHGYNEDFPDASRMAAQFADDLKFSGPVILFSWPSQGSLTSYTVDETNAQWSQAHFVEEMSALLEQVLEEVETECYEDGKTVHWHVFYDRVVSPITENHAAPSMQEISSKYGIADSAKASNMIVTVKRRFQTALQKRLQESAASREEADSELEETVRFLAKIAQDHT